MQKENLMETVVSVAAPDRSVPAVCAKTVTRLDALRRRMLEGMGAAQAEPILEDLRYVAEYAGPEEEIAWREEEAELAS